MAGRAGRGPTKGSFKKGDKRINRKGRPKLGNSLAEKFRDAMQESLTGDYTKLDSIIDAIVTEALKGDKEAIDFTLARGYGKLPDRIEVTPKEEFDLSKLTDAELATFMALRKKLDDQDTKPD